MSKDYMKRIHAYLPVLVAAGSLLSVIAVVGGCNNENTAQQPVTPTEVPAIVPSTSPQSDLPGDKPATGRKITVYSVAQDADGNQRLEPKEVALPGDSATTPALFALETLLSTAESPIPAGTKLRSVKISEGGMATVDFSHEIKDNFPGGDSAEALLINAVLSTLGQFKSVKTVQFLIDGKKIDSLGGGQTLDEPLPVPQAGSSASIPDVATPPFAGTGGR
ncbi:MAG: GerMN domain-containing protein [Fibrella sp.]|nr:GerMN domain-containing protein [Armatimonadota bacterium]